MDLFEQFLRIKHNCDRVLREAALFGFAKQLDWWDSSYDFLSGCGLGSFAFFFHLHILILCNGDETMTKSEIEEDCSRELCELLIKHTFFLGLKGD